MANKYLALQKEVFDISKVTVVGSPTITSDGVASGFSVDNYISTGIMPDYAKSFDIHCKFKTTGQTPPNGRIIGFNGASDYNNILCLSTLSSNYRILFVLKGTTHNNNNVLFDYNQYYDFWINYNKDTSTYTLKYKKTEEQDYTLFLTFVSSDVLPNTNDVVLGFVAAQLFNGSIDLNAFKIYVDGQLVFQPTKPTYLLERRKPTVWNKGQFTIVGNPSISDDGVASGFSKTSYIEIPNTNLQNANTWEIEGVVQIFSQGVKDDKAWLSISSGNGIMLPVACTAGSTDIQYQLYLSSTNNTWDISADDSIRFPSGSIVKCNLKFTGTQYIYTCTNLTTGEVKQAVKNSTLKVYQSPTQLGCKRNTDALKTNDSINLKQFKIYTDNTLVFDGGAETYVYDASKFTVVGSPTITSDGIMTTTTYNYVKVQPIYEYRKSFNIHGAIRIDNNWTSDSTKLGFILGGGTDSTYTVRLQLTYYNAVRVRFHKDVDGTATEINEYINTPVHWQAGSIITYDIGFNADTMTYYCKLYVDEVLAVNYSSVDTYYPYIGTNADTLITIGVMQAGYAVTGGYFTNDLKQFSITVDGKEVFTGAKVGHYVLRR